MAAEARKKIQQQGSHRAISQEPDCKDTTSKIAFFFRTVRQRNNQKQDGVATHQHLMAVYLPCGVDIAVELEHHGGGGGRLQEWKQEQEAGKHGPPGSHGSGRRLGS